MIGKTICVRGFNVKIDRLLENSGVRFNFLIPVFQTQDSRFRISDIGFWISHSRLKTQDSRFKIQDSRFKIMKRTAIFFGPEKGSVNRVADMICALIGTDKVEMVPVKSATAADFERFDQIIFGISTVGKETWDGKPAKTDWGIFLPEVSKGNFAGKKVAIFGLGDHITYAASFVDFIGLLAGELKKADATLYGQVPVEGYEFEESEAVADGLFAGLPIDEDFEPEKTPERIKNWIALLQRDFDF